MTAFIDNKNIGAIDFLKGIAILFVIFMHSVDSKYLYSIHQELFVGQAVPVFITITFFLAFRKLSKGENPIKEWFEIDHLKKSCRRIFIPFIVVAAVQLITMILFKCNDLIINMLCGGVRTGAILYMGLCAVVSSCTFFICYIKSEV